MSFVNTLKKNEKLKQFIHRLLIPKNQAKPRLWVKLFVNPFFHKRGKNSVVCRWTRMDVLPFNKFVLGNNSTIEDFSTINNGVGDVIIGNNTRIGLSNVVIGPVMIGDNVMFAQNILLSGLNHGFENPDIAPALQKISTAQITVENDVWIGGNVSVTAGVTIGKHSVIGAGSVITKSVPPYSVAVGNPARVIKKYNFESRQWEKVQ